MSETKTSVKKVAKVAEPKKTKSQNLKGYRAIATQEKDWTGTKMYLYEQQVAILKALNRFKKPLTAKELAERSGVSEGFFNDLVGRTKPGLTEARDKEASDLRKAENLPGRWQSLVGWGYADIEQHEIDGRKRFVYVLTAAGRKAVTNLK